MTQTEEEMTARVIRAMENEYVTMLGHATGRLLLQREGYNLNLEKIIDCAARTGTWIELNCSGWRMDMDWRWWHRARDKGVKCVINPDAHRVAQFSTLRHGVTVARKGWLRREDVMNTMTLATMRKSSANKGRDCSPCRPSTDSRPYLWRLATTPPRCSGNFSPCSRVRNPTLTGAPFLPRPAEPGLKRCT